MESCECLTHTHKKRIVKVAKRIKSNSLFCPLLTHSGSVSQIKLIKQTSRVSRGWGPLAFLPVSVILYTLEGGETDFSSSESSCNNLREDPLPLWNWSCLSSRAHVPGLELGVKTLSLTSLTFWRQRLWLCLDLHFHWESCPRKHGGLEAAHMSPSFSSLIYQLYLDFVNGAPVHLLFCVMCQRA